MSEGETLKNPPPVEEEENNSEPESTAEDSRPATDTTDSQEQAASGENIAEAASEKLSREANTAPENNSDQPVANPEAAEAPTSKEKELEKPKGISIVGNEHVYTREIQKMLSKYFGSLQTDLLLQKPGEDISAYLTRLQNSPEDFRQKLADLKREQEAGVWGEQSQELFKSLVNTFSTAVPQRINTLSQLGLPVETDCPMQLPRTDSNALISPELFREAIEAHELSFDMNIDSSKMPGQSEFVSLATSARWLEKTTTLVQTEHNKNTIELQKSLIEENGLPSAWKEQLLPGENPPGQIETLTTFINFYNTLKNYALVANELNKAGLDEKTPRIPLPEGFSIKQDGGHERLVVDKNAVFPTHLSLSHPDTIDKMERYQKWLDENKTKLDQVLDTKTYSWGEELVTSKEQTVFDKESGEFVRKTSRNPREIKDGETTIDSNLIWNDLDIKTLPDGKIEITQTKQAQMSLGYKNLIWENVGKPDTETRAYNPDDLIRVKSHDQEYLLTASQLQALNSSDRLKYWAGKGIEVSMDVAMVLSGTFEMAAARSAMKLGAKEGLKEGIRLTAAEQAHVFRHGLYQFGLGASGALDYAGSADDPVIGALLNTRHALFTKDILHGGSGAFRTTYDTLVEKLPGMAESMAQSTKATEKFSQFIKQFPRLNIMQNGLHGLSQYTGYGLIAHMGIELKDQWYHDSTNHFDIAKQRRTDGQSAALPDFSQFIVPTDTKPASLDKILEGYSATLLDGLNGETRDQAAHILDRAQYLLQEKPDATEEEKKQLNAEKEEFKHTLARYFTLTPENIAEFERGRLARGTRGADAQINDGDLSDLTHDKKPIPEVLGTGWYMRADDYPDPTTQKAGNDEIRTSAALALLMLSIDENGQLPETIAQTSITVPAIKHEVIETDPETGIRLYPTVTIPEHSINFQVDRSSLTSALKKDFVDALRNLDNDAISLGDFLTRTGDLSGVSYVQGLEDFIASPETSKADKLRALVDNDTGGLRYINIIQNLSAIENLAHAGPSTEAAKASALLYGTSSADLKQTLENMITNEADPDLSALAAATLYGLKEQERHSDFVKLLNNIKAARPDLANSASWQNIEQALSNNPLLKPSYLQDNQSIWQSVQNETPGKTREQIIASLKEDMHADIPENTPAEQAFFMRDKKLAAALMLSKLDNSEETKNEIMQTITSCMTPTSELADLQNHGNDIVKHLLYTRILDLNKRVFEAISKNEQLSGFDQTTISALASQTIGLVRKPQSREEETALISLLHASQNVIDMAGQDQKIELANKLKSMLNTSDKENFAGAYAGMRAEACTILARFGDRSAMDLIRARTSIIPKPDYLAHTNLFAGEVSGDVRQAAFDALVHLGDKEKLPIILKESLATEVDPAVKDKILALIPSYPAAADAKETARSIKEAKKENDYQVAISNLLSSALSHDDVRDLLPTVGNLLPRSNWEDRRSQAAEDAYDNMPSTSYWAIKLESMFQKVGLLSGNDPEGEAHLFMTSGTGKTDKARLNQWDDLVQLATLGHTDNPQQLSILARAITPHVEKAIQEKQEEIHRLEESMVSMPDSAKVDIEQKITNLRAQIANVPNLNDPNTLKEIGSAFAKTVIYDMLAHGAEAFSDGSAQSNPYYKHLEMPEFRFANQQEWQNAAAQTLAKCCEEGTPGRAQALDYVSKLLTTPNTAISNYNKSVLLHAFIKAAKPTNGSKDDVTINQFQAQYADVLLRALQVEQVTHLSENKPKETSDSKMSDSDLYLSQIALELAGAEHYPAVATLQAFVDDRNRTNSPIGKEGEAVLEFALDSLKHRVGGMYFRTVADQLSDAETRADQLSNGIAQYKQNSTNRNVDQEAAARELVQSVFNSYKNYKFKDETDPGIDVLGNLLNSENERVQLAAAYAALDATSNLPPGSELQNQALAKLADLAMETTNNSYRTEALEKLSEYCLQDGDNYDESHWQKDGQLMLEASTREVIIPATDSSPERKYIFRQEPDGAYPNENLPIHTNIIDKHSYRFSVLEQTGDEITGSIYYNKTTYQEDIAAGLRDAVRSKEEPTSLRDLFEFAQRHDPIWTNKVDVDFSAFSFEYGNIEDQNGEHKREIVHFSENGISFDRPIEGEDKTKPPFWEIRVPAYSTAEKSDIAQTIGVHSALPALNNAQIWGYASGTVSINANGNFVFQPTNTKQDPIVHHKSPFLILDRHDRNGQ